MIQEEMTPELAEALILRSKSDLTFHVQEVQGVDTLEEYQKRILDAIIKHDRVTIRSCHDLGKTFTMAKVVLAFSSTFEQSKCITTAPTFNQVKRLLWSEIRAGYRRSRYPLGGQMLTTEWKIEEDWFALGFTSKNEATGGEGQGTASGFQGFHAKYILIIFDEATGIPKLIWDQLEGMMTSANVKFVCIGNPTSQGSEFYKTFKDVEFHKIKLSCFDSPNLIANNILNIEDLKDELAVLKSLNDEEQQRRLQNYKVTRPHLLTAKWVMGRALKWGITHPLFVSKVLGEFPEEGENVAIPLGIVERAQARWENLLEAQTTPGQMCNIRVVGVDCARFGPDKTVITMLEDDVQTYKETKPRTEIGEIVGMVIGLINTLKVVRSEKIVVDGTGLGGGVVDGLRDAQREGTLRKNIIIVEINNAEKCPEEEDQKHYANIKALMFKNLSDSLKEDLALMPETVYQEELPLIIYTFTKKGLLAVESKEDFNKRTGMGSPDDSDALALANFGRTYHGGVGEFTRDMVPKKKTTFAGSMTSRGVKRW